MRKPDEIALFEAVRKNNNKVSYALIEGIGMNFKRAYALLIKWSDKGWLDYGVSPFGGWLTNKAPQQLSVFERHEPKT